MSIELLAISAHLIADFPLQPDWMAKSKTESGFVLAGHLIVHVLVLSAFLSVFTQVSSSTLLAIVGAITTAHGLIDSRRWVSPKESWSNPVIWVWLNDQIMHITTIAIVVVLVQ